MSAHAILKARTAAAHAAIDDDFSRFDLGCRASYTNFLLTHARVLPAIEAVLAYEVGLPPWRQRTVFLAEDLHGLAHDLPGSAHLDRAGKPAEMFGLLYVLEGSRLGGDVLSRRVGRGLPKQFLSAVHRPGEWRAFKMALESRADTEGEAWLEGVIAGASRGFGLYQRSVRQIISG